MMNETLKRIEEALYSYINKEECLEKNIYDSMFYSLEAGGKRIRPYLTLAFCELCGTDKYSALSFACAVEMIHTYSLIHDDLPCMDDDNLRRGKPSNHIVFGEDIALLAGDALQSLAFEIMSNESSVALLGADKCIKAVNTLSAYCGADGMVGGQVIDLENENKKAPLETIKVMHKKKTGALIKAACELGCIAGGADEKMIKAARLYAENIGLAFQIMDDILDVTSTASELGKPVGSDSDNNKSTYVSLLGIEKCSELLIEHTQKAIDALSDFDGDTTALCELAVSLSKRTN